MSNSYRTIKPLLGAMVVLIATQLAIAQQPIPASEQKQIAAAQAPKDSDEKNENRLSAIPKNLLIDQKQIWLSPLKLRSRDLTWVVPFTFATATTFAVDQAVERKLSTDPNTISRASSLSNYLAVAYAGSVAGAYVWGLHTHNEHLRRTGLLAGEAAVNSLAIATATKLVTFRERPTDGTGQGRFFEASSHFNSSFPSQHSAAAWAIATVVASEYPGPLTKFFAFGGASAISVSRIIGRDHFPSDVLIGSALGWYVGSQVYKNRSPRAETLDIGTVVKEPRARSTRFMGSPFVPLDSWVYPVFDRMNASGVFRTALIGLRPWTRMECARLLLEAEDASKLSDVIAEEWGDSLQTLDVEFAKEKALLGGAENVSAEISSVYTRTTLISGTPLSDSLHFGQTITNDFGRPYREGVNQILGVSATAEAGPLAFYSRGEYQYAPSADPLPMGARTAIAQTDNLPVMPGDPLSAVNRFRLLDSYVALNVSNWQLSFGKQSLWWGPGASGDLMFSNNAEPIWMLRLARTTSSTLPSLLRFLGPARIDAFLGQIQGYHFLKLGPTFNLEGSWNSFIDPQPALWGAKLNFKPTPNLELGFSLTTVFAGRGRPLTLSTFKHTFSSSGNAQAVEPGDRRTGFDFSYRLPGLRKWLTVYNGSLAEDEPNPIGYPRRSAMNPGLYLTHVPALPKLDLRVESVYTNLPGNLSDGFFYRNAHYAGGYTNFGQVIGNWVGPQGIGLQAWSSYWLHPRKKIQLGWRHQEVDRHFMQGGKLQDYSARFEYQFPRGLSVDTTAQYEYTNFPALSSTPDHNVAFSIMFTYRPRERDLKVQ